MKNIYHNPTSVQYIKKSYQFIFSLQHEKQEN